MILTLLEFGLFILAIGVAISLWAWDKKDEDIVTMTANGEVRSWFQPDSRK